MNLAASRSAWIAVSGIALVAVAFRLVGLGDWTLWIDESWSRWMATSDWNDLRERAAAYDTHPPVYYLALKLWLGLAPVTPWGMRLLSALAGLLTVLVAWGCARAIPRLSSPAWAVPLAVALVAMSLPLIVASRQARPYALWALAVAVALWAALALLRRREESRTAWELWVVYALALEAVLWLHSLGVLFAGALGGGLALALVANDGIRRNVVLYLIAHGAAALGFLPGLASILEHRRNWTSTWLGFDIADVPDGLAAGLAIPGAMAIPLFALAGIGAATMLRRRIDGSQADRASAVLLLSVALAPAAATILLSLVSSPVFLPRTLAPSVVPLMLLAAAGAGSAGHEPIKRITAALCLALSAFISVVALRQGPEERWQRVATVLEARVGRSEEVWLLPNELALPLGYAAGTRRYVTRGIPGDFPAPSHPGPRPSGTRAVPGVDDTDAVRLIADARARGMTGVWLVSRWSKLFDPADAVRGRLGRARCVDRSLAPLIVEHYVLPKD